MKTETTGALMGLVTKFAAEIEQLSEQTKTSREAISAKVLSDLAEKLHRGAAATGTSESRIVEECLKASLDAVIRRLLVEMDTKRAEFERLSRETKPPEHSAARPHSREVKQSGKKYKGPTQ